MNHWLLLAILSAVFAALTTILAKAGLKDIDSDYATLVRTIVIVCILVGFVITTGKWRDPFSLSGRSLLFLVLSAIATGASWICYYRALQAGNASAVAAVDKLSVVLVAVFAALTLGERLNVREWFGIAMVGLGVVCLSIKR